MDMKRFNERMGKRQNYAKGGRIKKIAGRKYFDAGGNTTLSGPAPAAGNNSPTVGDTGPVGALGNALGLNNNFQAQSANIQQGTNVGQLNTAYQGVQGGLTQQQALANQVQPGTQQGLGSQQALTGQLQGVIAGTGPNAAQTALAANTTQNVANQAALMAGQRGASQNAGLIASEAAQQGAATEQQAVGQAAATQAQQQISAQEQLANLAQTQVGQGAQAIQGVNQTQQNEQNILQGANTAANNAAVAMQSNINATNAQIATANQQMAGNIVSGIGNALGSVTGLFAKGGEVGHHCAGAHCTDRAHYMHMMADGGPLKVDAPVAKVGVGQWVNSSPDTSGPSQVQMPSAMPSNAPNPFSQIGSGGEEEDNSPTEAQTAKGNAQLAAAPEGPIDLNMYGGNNAVAKARGGAICKGPHQSHVANFLAQGGAVQAMVSPGEKYLNPEEVRRVVEHGENPLKMGRDFKGKAKVKGDSLKNDTIPETLEEGGVVIPRHIMNKKNKDHAELFVRRAVHMKAPKGK